MSCKNIAVLFLFCVVTISATETNVDHAKTILASPASVGGDIPVGPPSNSSTPKPITTTHPTTPSTKPTSTPEPSPSTTKPTSTNSPPTKPTSPTTPTTKPTSSPTPITKPTSPTTPTTKPTPSTKPTIPPTPSPKPNPPKPKALTWSLNYTSRRNESCIVAHMAVEINVTIFDQKKNTSKTMDLILPESAKVLGQCKNENDTTEEMTLMWKEDNYSNISISLKFNKNNTDKRYVLSSIDVSLLNFSSIAEIVLSSNQTVFAVPEQRSYKCSKESSFNLTSKMPNVTAVFLVSDMQIEAFRTEKSSVQFADAVDCESSNGTPDIVPIAVGCALAALVVIVLIAYLYGRRRAQARGYLSMFSETKREEDFIPLKNLSCFN